MNPVLLDKIINKKRITEKDREEILHQICEDTHSGCDFSCPIWSDVLSVEQRVNSDCPYFKNGKKMLKALRKESK